MLLLIGLQASFLWLFAPPVVGLLVGLVLAVVFARRRFSLRLRPVRRRLRYLVLEALPIGPALLISVLYLKLDTLILAALRPAARGRHLRLGLPAGRVPVPGHGGDHQRAVPAAGPAVAPRRTATSSSRCTAGAPSCWSSSPCSCRWCSRSSPRSWSRLVFGAAYAEAASPLRILAAALVAMTVSALAVPGAARRRPAAGHPDLQRRGSGAGRGSVLLAGRQLGMVGRRACPPWSPASWCSSPRSAAVWRPGRATLDPRRLARVLLAAAAPRPVLAGLQAAQHPLGARWSSPRWCCTPPHCSVRFPPQHPEGVRMTRPRRHRVGDLPDLQPLRRGADDDRALPGARTTRPSSWRSWSPTTPATTRPRWCARIARATRSPVRLLSSDERLPAVKRNQALRRGRAATW